jgi:2-aminoethylphosphonate-pyruvate transaminase
MFLPEEVALSAQDSPQSSSYSPRQSALTFRAAGAKLVQEILMDLLLPIQYRGPDGQDDMAFLMTPGPVTTSRQVKLAMLADYGLGDAELDAKVRMIRSKLLAMAGCDSSFECILLPGDGSFAIEAALGSFAPKSATKTLVVANGLYGNRAAAVLERLGRPFLKIDKGEAVPTVSDVEPLLAADKSISHVWMVHCEMQSGLINPIAEFGRTVRDKGRVFMVDAVSTLGALPIDMMRDHIDVLISAPHVCIESVPGCALVIVKRNLLEVSSGNSHSHALDLRDLWKSPESAFHMTPPTHVLSALHQALLEHEEEGGVAARNERYRRNGEILVAGMRSLGFSSTSDQGMGSSAVRVFGFPDGANIALDTFVRELRARGFAIPPAINSAHRRFRVGVAGKIDDLVIDRFLAAVGDVMSELNSRVPTA